jgi:hypothetical protein
MRVKIPLTLVSPSRGERIGGAKSPCIPLYKRGSFRCWANSLEKGGSGEATSPLHFYSQASLCLF